VPDAHSSDSISRFPDRQDAGRQLADAVEHMITADDSVILALPRGGVPVAYEVASRVGAPLDVLLVRKLGVPWQPELAFGAIASPSTSKARSPSSWTTASRRAPRSAPPSSPSSSAV